MGYLDQILHTFISSFFSAAGMQNGDIGMPIIILAGRGLLVNMLIHVTLEPHSILSCNFAY